MTNKTKPVEVTAPAIPADEAFANIINAERDTALTDESALQSLRVARDGQYDRDRARLDAAHDADIASLDEQIAGKINIVAAADAALVSLKGASNVVALKAAE